MLLILNAKVSCRKGEAHEGRGSYKTETSHVSPLAKPLRISQFEQSSVVREEATRRITGWSATSDAGVPMGYSIHALRGIALHNLHTQARRSRLPVTERAACLLLHDNGQRAGSIH